MTNLDPRKEKRALRKLGMSDPVQDAYYEGEAAAEWGIRIRINHYPPGKRHDEWERGFNSADSTCPHLTHYGHNE